jgi:hypothetical protein
MSDPFVLDNWMIRLLIEHSSDLSERQMPKSKSAESSTVGTSNAGHTNAQGKDLPGSAQANYSTQIGAEAHGLSDLLQDQEVTCKALVNHAIDWLLE